MTFHLEKKKEHTICEEKHLLLNTSQLHPVLFTENHTAFLKNQTQPTQPARNKKTTPQNNCPQIEVVFSANSKNR